MQLVSLHDISLSHGKPPLLDHIGLAIESGERVCLIGSNGAGKTTLLKIVAGQVMVDDGFVQLSAGVRITHLEQEVPQDTAGTVFDIIAGGLGAAGLYSVAKFATPSDRPILMGAPVPASPSNITVSKVYHNSTGEHDATRHRTRSRDHVGTPNEASHVRVCADTPPG